MTKKQRLRLTADRLCYLEKGRDGLRYRNGMRTAYEAVRMVWWDEYDEKALTQLQQNAPAPRGGQEPG